MKPILKTLVIASFILSAALLSGYQSEDKPVTTKETVYLNANFIDAEKRDVRLVHISVRNGKIVSVTTEKPDLRGKSVVDLNQQFVLPGFIDMHVHSWGNNSVQENYQWLEPRGTLKAALYSGVYGMLDLFSDEDDIFGYRNQQDNSVYEAKLFAAGPCITAPKGHCSQFGTPTRIITTPEQAKREVADLATKKPDVIKVVFDSATFSTAPPPTVDKATLKALVAEAKKQNIPSIVHVGSWQDVRGAAEVGADMVTHTPMTPMPEDIPDLMKKQGTAIVPTLTVQTEWEVALNTDSYFENSMLKAVTTPELIADYHFDLDSKQFARLKAFIKRNEKIQASKHMDSAIKSLHEAGVPVLVGTDAGNALAFHGYSYHRELHQLVEAGLSEWDVLHSATVGAASELRVDWGIKSGANANFLVLESSPLVDINNTQTISMLVQHGQIVDRLKLQSEINPDIWQKLWMYATGW